MKKKPIDGFVSTTVLKAKVDRTAEQMKRSRSWVMREALHLGLSLLAQREADRLLRSISVEVQNGAGGAET